MNNVIIKNIMKKYDVNTIKILNELFSDCIVEMTVRNCINKDTLIRIEKVYLSLFDKKKLLDYSDLSVKEKNIICSIISKGIASIYVDEEYLDKNTYKDRLFIIEDMINLLCVLSGFNKSTVKRLVNRDVKVYFYKGWKWDFI